MMDYALHLVSNVFKGILPLNRIRCIQQLLNCVAYGHVVFVLFQVLQSEHLAMDRACSGTCPKPKPRAICCLAWLLCGAFPECRIHAEQSNNCTTQCKNYTPKLYNAMSAEFWQCDLLWCTSTFVCGSAGALKHNKTEYTKTKWPKLFLSGALICVVLQFMVSMRIWVLQDVAVLRSKTVNDKELAKLRPFNMKVFSSKLFQSFQRY